MTDEPSTRVRRLELIPLPTARRLSLYLRQLEMLKRMERRTVSSQELAESLKLTAAQVRSDLAYLGQFGHPGVGYRVQELVNGIRHVLGTDRTWNVLLVGAGRLGQALMAYEGFNDRGFRLVAVFDKDPGKIGRRYGRLTVEPMDNLAQAVQKWSVELAVIAVPAAQSQTVADALIRAGVRGLLNFAPVHLVAPDDVALYPVDLAIPLEQLAFQVNLPGIKGR